MFFFSYTVCLTRVYIHVLYVILPVPAYCIITALLKNPLLNIPSIKNMKMKYWIKLQAKTLVYFMSDDGHLWTNGVFGFMPLSETRSEELFVCCVYLVWISIWLNKSFGPLHAKHMRVICGGFNHFSKRATGITFFLCLH